MECQALEMRKGKIARYLLLSSNLKLHAKKGRGKPETTIDLEIENFSEISTTSNKVKNGIRKLNVETRSYTNASNIKESNNASLSEVSQLWRGNTDKTFGCFEGGIMESILPKINTTG
jgi:hypothetical protein